MYYMINGPLQQCNHRLRLNTLGPQIGRGAWLAGTVSHVPGSVVTKLCIYRDSFQALANGATCAPLLMRIRH